VAGLAEIAAGHQLPGWKSIVTILTTGRARTGTQEDLECHPERSSNHPQAAHPRKQSNRVVLKITDYGILTERLINDRIWLLTASQSEISGDKEPAF
jgi:hypothetical protein